MKMKKYELACWKSCKKEVVEINNEETTEDESRLK